MQNHLLGRQFSKLKLITFATEIKRTELNGIATYLGGRIVIKVKDLLCCVKCLKPKPRKLLWPIRTDACMQGIEPIRIRSNYTKLVHAKRRKLFSFCFSLVEGMGPVLPTNHKEAETKTKANVNK